jgi:maltooligosyltrehalose synthase
LLNQRVEVTEEEVENWLAICKNAEELRAHLLHEQRQLKAPLTADAVRWLQLAINGRWEIGEQEIEYWRGRCSTVADLREILMREQSGAL